MESPVSLSAVFGTNFTSNPSPQFFVELQRAQSQGCSLFPLAVEFKSRKKRNCNSSAIGSAFKANNSTTVSYPSRASVVPSAFPPIRTSATSTSPSPSTSPALPSTASGHCHWKVFMEAPPPGIVSKPEIIDYYVNTLKKILGSEKDAQMCIYDASWGAQFGFCCDIDEETAHHLACLPGVLSVRPDRDFNSLKDYSHSKTQSSPLLKILSGSTSLFPGEDSKHWLVRLDKPTIGVVSKAQMVDYYTKALTKVMGNEKDAQMCIYHISWKSNFGFCCVLNEECAQELAGVPGVMSVQPDENFESDNKDYAGENPLQSGFFLDSSAENEQTTVKTKKLFVTGLSFYTSEKTLRAAFEGFGELIEVKVIMDKISKRSKGYAFVEYTTEEAASVALREMNGKIINGWMITVDVAKSNPPKYSRGRPRLLS